MTHRIHINNPAAGKKIAGGRSRPNVADPVKALRALLKIALRKLGLRCVSCEEEQRR